MVRDMGIDFASYGLQSINMIRDAPANNGASALETFVLEEKG